MGAYTTVEECGNGFVPYIVAYWGSFSDRSWAETMAVHELNHALQFSYGFAWEFWWWEATAAYVGGQVYPTSDWWAYYVDGYSQNPQLAMNASAEVDELPASDDVTGDIVDGVGTLTMPDFGGEDVMLVASPLRATDDKFAFAWSADLVAPEVLDTAEDTGAPLAGDDDTAGEQPSGCGCASTGDVGGLGLGMLLSVATLARRRRG